jgi:transketolase
MLEKIAELEEKANWVRKQTLEMCVCGGGGHLVSSFSCTDILVALYYGGILRFDPANPHWEERDRFIISKGHGANALYPILADLGFFPMDELAHFCGGDSMLGVHPDHNVPGIEVITGSLGHGLGIASGLALAAKMDGKTYRVTSLLGDGECYEGGVWEAAMFAAHHQLDNLTGIIDRNGLSVTDFTEKSLKLDPLVDKWQAFGWDTLTINGHDFREILKALKDDASRTSGKPLMIIGKTVKGKGVSFMENNPLWHTLLPSGEELKRAREELNQAKQVRQVKGR